MGKDEDRHLIGVDARVGTAFGLCPPYALDIAIRGARK
jgi:hypothetical protein